MDTVIISGGDINSDFALDFLRRQQNILVIAADRGLEFCIRHQIRLDHLVGDFDSVGQEMLSELESTVLIHRLKPEKDDSDTQSAVNLAVSLGAEKIWILGGTGSRLDHVMANLELLVYGLAQGVKICLLDDHNRITAENRSFTLKREEQFGRYVSFFPIGSPVEGLTLRGFKYPLDHHFLQVTDTGLTVSNEIIEEEAKVEFATGKLLMIQSRD
ncbi:MAG: thiamine diphosphokinase [Blautia sp.]|jgi:thiamine pyrophosphokinase